MKIELHAHTSETSPCGHICAGDMVSLYKKAGYQAMVVTDHYSKWVLEQHNLLDADKNTVIDHILAGYHAASAAAGSDFSVWPGTEVNLLESPNDYLLYGITEEFLYEAPLLYTLSLKELSALCHKHDILLFQAHPYRTYCTPADPALLDGVEVFNGNLRHESHNEKALDWQQSKHLLFSSGSDFHEIEDLARGGIDTAKEVHNLKELCALLRTGEYQVIHPEQ